MIISNKSLRKHIKELESSIKTLRVSEEKYRRVWEYAPDAIFLTKIGGEDSGLILDANPAASMHTGYSLEELIGMNIVTALPADKEAKVLVGNREKGLMKGNQLLLSEKKKRKDGSEYWTEVHIRDVLVGDEQIALAINRDITERKKAEKDLIKREKEFQDCIENSGVGFATDNRDGNIAYCNKTFADIFGYSIDEIKEQSHKSLVHPDDMEKIKKTHYQRILGSNSFLQYEFRGVKKDGSIVNLEASVDKIVKEGEEIVGTQTFIKNITERKKAEEKILHLNSVLRTIRDVNQLIVKEKDRDSLIQTLCKILTENKAYLNAWILLLRKDGKYLSSAEHGIGESFALMKKKLEEGEFPDCISKALQRKELIVTENPIKECHDCPLTSNYANHCGFAVSLVYGDKIFGILVVSVPLVFCEYNEEQQLLIEVSEDIAFALNSIKTEELHKEADEELLQLKNELEIRVKEKTKEVFEKNHELQRFNDVMIDRELRMEELYKENEKLKAEAKKKDKI